MYTVKPGWHMPRDIYAVLNHAVMRDHFSRTPSMGDHHSEYTDLGQWTSECSQSYAQGMFVDLVIYVGRKTGDLFMNESFMNEWSADFHNHQ